MKKYLLFILVATMPYSSYAQYEMKRFKGTGNRNNMHLVNKADALAYKRACNDSIYTYDVLLSYLQSKNISVDEVTEDHNLREIFKRVVSKRKKFKDDDKRVWKQEFYNFEYDKILSSMIKERSAEDSIKRNNWFQSDTYLALKYFSQYAIPEVNDNDILMLGKYNIGVSDIYYTYRQFERYDSKDVIKHYREYFDDKEHYNFTESDFNCIHNYLRSNLKDTTVIMVYRQILKEMKYLDGRNFSGIDPSLVGMQKVRALFELDKDNDNVKELEMLVKHWLNANNNQLWEKYNLTKSDKFKKVCSKINEALEYRKTHPLTDGVIRFNNYTEENRKENTSFLIKEIPYKVSGDYLVVDGDCFLNIIEDQYRNATGDFYKKYTMNAKVLVKVENGVAVSKKITGFHKVWEPDKKVWDKTKGGFLQKTASTLEAKPVVARTNDLSKLDDTEVLLSTGRIEELLSVSTIEEDSVEDLVRLYLKFPTDSRYVEKIYFPIKKIETKKLYYVKNSH